jgi:hypothetical protein
MGKIKTRSKILLWQVLGVAVTFAPILVEILLNRHIYFATKDAGVSLTIGGIIAVILVAMAMLGKLSKFMGSEIRVVGVIFVLSILLEPILLNFKLLSGLLLAGMCANGIFIKPKIKKLLRRKNNEETASVLKEALHGN